ncbi:MAG: coproporphyrinogen III oxidase [Ferruginibacter sp.]
MTLPADIDDQEDARAAAWFRQVRDDLVRPPRSASRPKSAATTDRPAGAFEIKPWTRPEGGGGEMGLLHGRVFEKAGVHISVVHGRFSEEFARQMPHTEAGAEFWSAGVSVIIHPWNPNVPAAHMNTRMIVTGKWWFGGGGDLTPVLDRRRTQTDPDSIDFHAAYQAPPATRIRRRLRRATRSGATSTSSSSTATSRAASAASSTTTHNSGDWDARLRLHPGCRPRLPRHLSRARPPQFRRRRGPMPTATSSWSAAAATSSSTCSTTAARPSASRPVAMSKPSCQLDAPRSSLAVEAAI